MKPIISIAMATYNGEQYLRKQLESIYAQSYVNIEVIITDDSSTDATVDILKEFNISHGLKYYINEHNLGFIKNFEKAINYCSGEYIALSDQDDIWLPNKLQTLINNINSYDIICSNCCLIDEKEQIISEVWRKNFEISEPKDLFIYLLFNNFVTGCTMMFRKDFFNRFSPIPETENYHDWWFATCATKNNGIKYLNQPLVLYRQHAEQNTGARINNQGKSWKVVVVSSILNRMFGRETNRVKYAKAQKKRLLGLMQSSRFDESEKKIIKEACIYFASYSKPFLIPKAFFIGMKYSHILYGKYRIKSLLLVVLDIIV